jgi:regulator of replication initiation timing
MKLQQQFADFVAQVDKSKVAVQKTLDENNPLHNRTLKLKKRTLKLKKRTLKQKKRTLKVII